MSLFETECGYYQPIIFDGSLSNYEKFQGAIIDAIRAGELKVLHEVVIREAGHNENQSGFAEFPEFLNILKMGNGWGYCHYIPDGYSSYTYDPSVTINIYKNFTTDQFIKLGLTEELRQHIKGLNLDTLDILYG